MKRTIIILNLLLFIIIALVLVILLVFRPRDNTLEFSTSFSDEVFEITNETIRIAEKRWKLDGSPSPEDRWRQEEIVKSYNEEKIKNNKPQELSDFYVPVISPQSTQLNVSEFIAEYYKAGNKGITNIFNRKDPQDDLIINEEFNAMNEKYLAQREKLINYVVEMFNKFGFTGTVIGLTGFCLIIWFGVATICEFIKYLILRFFSYVVSRLV